LDSEKQEFWESVLLEYHHCHGTVKSFCEDYGIAVWQFYYWKKRLSSKAECSRAFSEVKLSESHSPGIRLVAGSIEICLDRDFDADFLKKVLRVLNC